MPVEPGVGRSRFAGQARRRALPASLGHRPKPFFALAVPASLERPGRAVRGTPVHRAKGPLDPLQCPGSPMAWAFAGTSVRRTLVYIRFTPRTFGLFRVTALMLQFPLPAGRGGLGWGGLGFGCAPRSAWVRGIESKTNPPQPARLSGRAKESGCRRSGYGETVCALARGSSVSVWLFVFSAIFAVSSCNFRATMEVHGTVAERTFPAESRCAGGSCDTAVSM